MDSYNLKYDLDDFIENDELNTQIYGVLLAMQDGAPNRIKLKRDIIHMFNKMYEMCHIIRQDKHPEMYFQNYWDKARAEHTSYETSIIFSGVYLILSLRPGTSINLSICLNRIKAKIDPAYLEPFEPILNSGKAYADGKALPPDFAFLKFEADKIEDLSKRELFYQEYQTRYKQAQNQGDILKQIEDEIKLIERTKALAVQENIEIPTESEKGVSSKVRAVVIMEMLKQMGKGKSANDLSAICRLVSFLTNQSEKKLYNEAQKGILLSSYHDAEISQVNEIMKSLNISISIEKNKDY
ncbi:MAG: hypothetical protein EOM44_02745 [Bacteroidia bacterium]|nr:hypothetical protein [Bacteroidia bacterium]